jgi:serine/threonine protein kinase
MGTTTIAPLNPGSLLHDRYVIQQVLAHNGLYQTYLALDQESFQKPCLLTEFVLGDQVQELERLRPLLQKELGTLCHLQHAQLPRMGSVFEQHKSLFVTLDYVEGITYQQILQLKQRHGKCLTEAEVVWMLKQILPVLGDLHGNQIMHRNISPEAILLPMAPIAEGEDITDVLLRSKPMLTQLGALESIANLIGSLSEDGPSTLVQLGQMGFAPPEQIQGGHVSPQSDLYALAVTCLVLLTGQPPQKLYDVESLTWRWDSGLVSQPLDAMLRQMLALRPCDRFDSTTAVIKALKAPKILPPEDNGLLAQPPRSSAQSRPKSAAKSSMKSAAQSAANSGTPIAAYNATTMVQSNSPAATSVAAGYAEHVAQVRQTGQSTIGSVAELIGSHSGSNSGSHSGLHSGSASVASARLGGRTAVAEMPPEPPLRAPGRGFWSLVVLLAGGSALLGGGVALWPQIGSMAILKQSVNVPQFDWSRQGATLFDSLQRQVGLELLNLGDRAPIDPANADPTNASDPSPTASPMAQPTSNPTAQPTSNPTSDPTAQPTAQPMSQSMINPGKSPIAASRNALIDAAFSAPVSFGTLPMAQELSVPASPAAEATPILRHPQITPVDPNTIKSLEGVLKDGGEQLYRFEGVANQHITLRLEANDLTTLNIFDAKQRPVSLTLDPEKQNWVGELPQNGPYYIHLKGSGNFRLEMDLE